MTVPAYQWLWSGHDEINHHHRRYTRGTLLAAAPCRGLAVHAPAPPTSTRCCCQRRSRCAHLEQAAHQSDGVEPLTCGCPPAPRNWLLQRPLNLEAAAIGRGGHIPAGLSLLAVLR